MKVIQQTFSYSSCLLFTSRIHHGHHRGPLPARDHFLVGNQSALEFTTAARTKKNKNTKNRQALGSKIRGLKKSD